MKNLNVIKSSLVLIVMMVLSLGNQVYAQGPQNAQMEAKRNELKAKLNLTPKQTEQFDEITKRNREEARQKAKGLPESASQKEKKDIMKASMEKADAEIIAILNVEQQKIFKEEKEKMRQERKEKAKAKRAGKPL